MDDKTCVICMDEFINSKIIKYNHCGNYYIHETCYKNWFNKNNSCFICREILINSDFIIINLLNENEQNLLNENKDYNKISKYHIFSFIYTSLTIFLIFYNIFDNIFMI